MQPIDVISRSDSPAAALQQESAQAPDTLQGAFQQALDAAQNQDAVLPVEAYSLPDWYAALIPDQCILASSLDDDSWIQADAWRQEHREELTEYLDILHGYFSRSLRENGVEGAEDYYESVVLDPAGSERVRQDFMERLAADPRALELMESLGVQAALPA